jgi:drug/metabolite transporter (DMT)-like permease
MSEAISHRRGVVLVMTAAFLWSIAGVFTRHLESARSFEVTFWRSLFAAIFVAGVLLYQQREQAFARLRDIGGWGWLSGLMWGVMFSCFMLALMMTTVANTLIVVSTSPLFTAFIAWLVLGQRIPSRTWFAIIAALAGIIWMFAGSMAQVEGTHIVGMTIALGTAISAAANYVIIQKVGERLDMMPAVMLGGAISALMMLPMSLPFQASLHDLSILALLGVFQLATPGLLVVMASKALPASEIALLALLEVLLGPIWAWLGAGEVPAQSTLMGGAVVLAALILNELAMMRRSAGVPAAP